MENKLSTWATEIHKDWSSGYLATADSDMLLVYYNNVEVARVDYNTGRYSVSGSDQHAVAQLEYMLSR